MAGKLSQNLSGAILVVSHDRYFLDAVCNRIFEIEDNTLTAYKGNYSAYLPQKEAAVALQQKQHDADMEKAAKLEDYIARNPGARLHHKNGPKQAQAA